MNSKKALYISTILEENSITAAAKKLYIAQPSLSQMIKSIEKEIGAPIFKKSANNIKLTSSGELYLATLNQMNGMYRNMLSEIDSIKDEKKGVLHLGVSYQRGLSLLPAVINIFNKIYPHVDLDLHEFGSAKLEVLLEEHKIDLALATTVPHMPSLNYQLLQTEQIGIFASRNTNLAKRIVAGTPITIEAARSENFIALKAGHSVRTVQNQLFSKCVPPPKIIVKTDNMEAAKKITLSCNAVMILPQVFIDGNEEYLKKGVFYPLIDLIPARHFYACTRKGDYLPRYLLDFIDIVIDVLKLRKICDFDLN